MKEFIVKDNLTVKSQRTPNRASVTAPVRVQTMTLGLLRTFKAKGRPAPPMWDRFKKLFQKG